MFKSKKSFRMTWARCLSWILCVNLILIGLSGVISAEAAGSTLDVESLAVQIDEAMADQIGCKAGQVLAQTDWFVAGDSISDWLAMDLCLAGVKEDYTSYVKQLEAYVTERYAEDGRLDQTKATEYHRLIIVVKALGKDPTDFGKHEDGSSVNLLEEGIFNYDGNLGGQGFNGYIWALLALDSGDYEAPEEAVNTRETIIQSLLDGQLSDGSFGLTDTSDVDITSMTVQALAPYVNDREDVKHAVDAAVTWLSGQLSDSCGIAYYDKENPESVSQLLIALTALGIDPEEDERFTRGAQTLLTQLETFRIAEGLYTHDRDENNVDYMATEQSLLAQIAVDNLRSGKGPVYQLQQVTAPTSGGMGMMMPLAVGGIVIVVVVLLLVMKKKKTSIK